MAPGSYENLWNFGRLGFVSMDVRDRIEVAFERWGRIACGAPWRVVAVMALLADSTLAPALVTLVDRSGPRESNPKG